MNPKSSPKSKKAVPTLAPPPLLRESNPVLLFAVLVVICIVVFGLFSVSSGRDNNWDLRNYHYYNPYAFFHGRLGFDLAPAQLQTFLNPTQDFLFYFLVTHLKPIWIGFFMGAIHGLNFVLIFAIAYFLLSMKTFPLRIGLSALCAAVGVYGPVFICELGASENDLLTCILVLLSFLILIRKLLAQDTLAKSRWALIFAGAVLGFAVGMKLTVTIYAVGIALALLLIEKKWKNRFVVLGIWGGAFIVGFAISAGYWMATLYSAYGSPLFPFYNQIFKSPYFDPIALVDKRYMPQSFLDALVYPFQFFTRTRFTYLSYDFRDSRYAVIYVLFILFIVSLLLRRASSPQQEAKGKKKSEPSPKKRILPNRAEGFLLIFFVASYIVWQVQFSIIRYIVPLEAIAPIVIVILALHIFPKSKPQSVSAGAALVIIGAFLIIAATVKPVYHERLPWSATFFQVEAPHLDNPDHTIVIIARDRPWAYLIPSFPPGVRFVSVHNNLTSPERPTKLQSEIRAVLQSHHGPIFLLSRPEYVRDDIQTLSAYQLSVPFNQSLPVKSGHEKAGLALWPVVRREG